MRAHFAAVVVAAVLLVIACGDGSVAGGELGAQVDHVRELAEAGEIKAAGEALDELTSHVQQLAERGELDSDRADAITRAATHVARELQLLTVASTTAPAPDTGGDDEGGDEHHEGEGGDDKDDEDNDGEGKENNGKKGKD